jgi:nucleotide-binding universal stress UspA family protein
MYARILVPTDFSEPSEAALAHAKALALQFGASLHLIHVVEEPAVLFGLEGTMVAPMTVSPPALDDVEARLTALLAPAERARFRATAEVVRGPVASTIVYRAGELGASLIVMGTHGRTGVSHAFVGSVAEKVVRYAACPVLTVHAMPIHVHVRTGDWAQATA